MYPETRFVPLARRRYPTWEAYRSAHFHYVRDGLNPLGRWTQEQVDEIRTAFLTSDVPTPPAVDLRDVMSIGAVVDRMRSTLHG